jgi:hypothetical protein
MRWRLNGYPGSNAPALEPLGITTLERGNEVRG